MLGFAALTANLRHWIPAFAGPAHARIAGSVTSHGGPMMKL